MKNKIISLITDFGTQDGYVGAMKGRILSIVPDATIVDITHDIEPQNLIQSLWTVFRSTRQFPEDSIHVVVVDPGVGSNRRPILLRSDNRWYIGPDNGVFSEIIRRSGCQAVYEIHRKTEWWQAHTSFDGLVLFAPSAAYLAAGKSLGKIGKIYEGELVDIDFPHPQKTHKDLLGEIVLFDRFGNAITNIKSSDLEQLPSKSIIIKCRDDSFVLVDHYQQEKNQEAIALINSDGFLELSLYQSSAQQHFELKASAPVRITWAI
ncbi:SAM-dependent chlorinase/fluorinase [bacterium]|nr:SAM-dependent chlorinase/fluorinase [bacterium]